MELNNEQKKLLEAATAALSKFNESLPTDGDFSLVNDKALNDLLKINKAYTRVFLKIKPIMDAVASSEQIDIMGVLPKLIPLAQGLGNDAEVKSDLATILSTL